MLCGSVPSDLLAVGEAEDLHEEIQGRGHTQTEQTRQPTVFNKASYHLSCPMIGPILQMAYTRAATYRHGGAVLADGPGHLA